MLRFIAKKQNPLHHYSIFLKNIFNGHKQASDLIWEYKILKYTIEEFIELSIKLFQYIKDGSQQIEFRPKEIYNEDLIAF